MNSPAVARKGTGEVGWWDDRMRGERYLFRFFWLLALALVAANLSRELFPIARKLGATTGANAATKQS